MKKKEKKKPHPLYTSILLLLMALAAATAATMAWLSIADNTKVKSMSLDVTAGASLRFDLDPHEKFEDYVKTLNFKQISARILKDKGFSMEKIPLEPVTTTNFSKFTFEDGSEVLAKTGVYLEFELNFMATKDMIVHLSSANDSKGQGGTAVSSKNKALPQAMRISFTTGGITNVYDPGRGNSSSTSYGAKFFGLPSAASMVYNQNNSLFSLKEGVNKVVLVHIWLEGTDTACTNDLKGSDYSISLKFQGTDENNKLFD